MDETAIEHLADTQIKKEQDSIVKQYRVLIIGAGCFLLILLTCTIAYFVFNRFTRSVKKEATSVLPWSTDENKEEKKLDNPKKTNSSVIVGKVQWEVLDAKSADSFGEGEKCKASDGNKLVYLKVKIKNLDRAFVTVLKSAIDIYDKDQSVYSVSANKTFTCLGDGKYDFRDKYIPPVLGLDEEKTFEFLYEVPKDTKGFKLKAGDLSTVGKEFEYIDLGF